MSIPFIPSGPAHEPPITSEFANDPDMSELVDLFLHELPARVRAASEAWISADFVTVQRLAHQLRGSSAGYGFPLLGVAAGRVEDAMRISDGDAFAATPELQTVFASFQHIAARVMAGGVRKAA